MAIKILATGDLHIGKRSSSVPVNVEETATKFTWNRIVQWCEDKKVDALLLSGDIVDQDNAFFEAVGHLQSGFQKLKQAGIQVYMVAGNHDFKVLPEIIASEKYENVHLLGQNGSWEVKTLEKNGQKLQFTGWSFPERYYNSDPLLDFDSSLIDPNIPCIGLVHGDVDSADLSYAPIAANSFLHKPVQAWIVGHIHKPWIINQSDPVVQYPGSPHAMSAKESGIHGALLLEIADDSQIAIEQVKMSPVRYKHKLIDISEAADEGIFRKLVTSKLHTAANDMLIDLGEVSYLVFDVTLTGEHPRINEVEKWVSTVSDYDRSLDNGTRVSVRKLNVNLRPKVDNLEELAREPSPAGMLAGTILSIQKDEKNEFLTELIQDWKHNREDLNRANVYQPLNKMNSYETDEEALAKASVLHECNRLLGELLAQRS